VVIDLRTTARERCNGNGLPANRRRQAAITVDFVLAADEGEPGELALREAGIVRRARSLLTQQPRLIFLLVWASTTLSSSPRGFGP
jgi:hypothetical protein